jgi:hypothetical protein
MDDGNHLLSASHESRLAKRQAHEIRLQLSDGRDEGRPLCTHIIEGRILELKRKNERQRND